ncbi:MAG: D-alanyl-D-alanine carboxypeptidase, partial [Planctomycetota bacterium]
MRHTLALLLLLVVVGCTQVQPAVAPTTQPSALATTLDEILTRHDTKAIVAARVVRVSDGVELYARNPDAPMIPASNMKLPVSAAALNMFGADYTFDTHLFFDSEHLTLVGTGDPALGDPTIAAWNGHDLMKPFDDFANALDAAGITHIDGDLLYDDTALPEPLVAPSWDTEDLVYWYAAPVSGLNFNDNCI